MRLVGFNRFKSKNGEMFCVANVVTPYTEREKRYDNFGEKVDTVFLPPEKVNYLKESDIGKEVEVSYDISGGRAYIVDFKVIDNGNK